MSEELTAAANQSETASTDEIVADGDHTETADTQKDAQEFERELDADWGIPTTQEENNEVEVPAEEDVEEEPQEEEPEPSDEPEDEPVEEATLRVNYMGQQRDLTLDEARRFAQIGMNAGNLQEKYNALKPLESLLKPLEIMALFRGQNLEDTIKDFGSVENLRRQEVAALVEAGNDQAIAEELFDSRYNEATQKREINRMKDNQDRKLSTHQMEQIERFAQFRPEINEKVINGEPLPEAVLNEWRNGTDLTTAWLLYENQQQADEKLNSDKQIKELKKQLKEAQNAAKKLQKNAENKAKAPTSKKGTGGGTGGIDIFSAWNQY